MKESFYTKTIDQERVNNDKFVSIFLKTHSFFCPRIFAFGIGPKISCEIVSRIARAGQGKAYFASAGVKIQTKVKEKFPFISSAVMKCKCKYYGTTRAILACA